jgi:D-tyrosyl-tRNA(Tyr) deacylase
MIALLQRVSMARVEVDGAVTGAIGRGLLVLLGVQQGDTAADAERLIGRVLDYRVFADDAGRMNRSLRDISGGLLLVPQFTLAADTRKGLRPGLSGAAPPDLGRKLYEHALAHARACHAEVGEGRFGADMQVTLTNDGPVTFWLQVGPQTA